jgi:hypothetical protein
VCKPAGETEPLREMLGGNSNAKTESKEPEMCEKQSRGLGSFKCCYKTGTESLADPGPSFNDKWASGSTSKRKVNWHLLGFL